MTTFLPFCLFSVAGVDAEMIPVGLGALLGIGVFLRGFHLLQRNRPVFNLPALNENDQKAPTPTSAPGAFAPKREEKQKEAIPLETHREIIRLSPTNGEEAASRARTQQGQIAAALVKAGISNPMSWSAPPQVSEVSVRTVETPGDRPEGPTTLLQALDLNASVALQEGLRSAKTAQKPVPQEFRWTPALMIWGGPILTLGCLYLIASHYQWL